MGNVESEAIEAHLCGKHEWVDLHWRKAWHYAKARVDGPNISSKTPNVEN